VACVTGWLNPHDDVVNATRKKSTGQGTIPNRGANLPDMMHSSNNIALFLCDTISVAKHQVLAAQIGRRRTGICLTRRTNRAKPRFLRDSVDFVMSKKSWSLSNPALRLHRPVLTTDVVARGAPSEYWAHVTQSGLTSCTEQYTQGELGERASCCNNTPLLTQLKNA
jgi:hypothetical protein